MPLAGKRLFQCLDRARFADPRLADECNDLTLARLRQAPAIEQQTHFMRAAEVRQPATSADRRKAAFDRRFAAHPPSRHWPRKSLQLVGAGRFELEQPTQQVLRGLTDKDRAGVRERLKPRGEIGSLADDATLRRVP